MVSVRYPSEKTKSTSKFQFFNNYPNVPSGAEIQVGYQPPKKDTPNDTQKSNTDWSEVLANSIAQATSVLTLILLLQRND